MPPQLASSLVASDAMPRICGSRHLVLSRIPSVVSGALMLTVMKLTSARLVGKNRPVSYERRSKSLLRRSPVGRDVGIPRKEGMTSWRTFFDLRALFKLGPRRYRTMLNVAFSWFGQFSVNKSVRLCSLLGVSLQSLVMLLTTYHTLLQMSVSPTPTRSSS